MIFRLKLDLGVTGGKPPPSQNSYHAPGAHEHGIGQGVVFNDKDRRVSLMEDGQGRKL